MVVSQHPRDRGGGGHSGGGPRVVTGGTWKPQWFETPQEFDVFASRLEQATLDDEPLVRSTTDWIKPFPLLIAGEGKNRVETYQEVKRP